MKRYILICLLSISLLAVANCRRGEFTKLDTPSIVVFLKSSHSIDLLEDAKTSEKPLGKLADDDNVEAIGILKLASATFLQVKCPSRIHCEDGLAYVQKDFVASGMEDVSEKSRAILVPINDSLDGGLERTRKTRDWFNNSNLDIPNRPNQSMILAQLNTIENPDEKLVKTLELTEVFTGIADPQAIKGQNLPIVERYAVLRKVVSTKPAQAVKKKDGEADSSAGAPLPPPAERSEPLVAEKELKEVLNSIHARADESLNKMLEGFAFRDEKWTGLSAEYNKMSKSSNLRERVLAKILDGGDFTVDPPLPDGATTKSAEWKIEVRSLDGAFLNAKIKPVKKGEFSDSKSEETARADAQLEASKTQVEKDKTAEEDQIRIISSTAQPDKLGLAFDLKTSRGNFKLKPREVPPFLAKGGPGLATLIASIPANWQTIQEKNDFTRALVLTALKFGKPAAPSGTSAYENGKLHYWIDTNDWHYWMMFGLIKKSPHIVVEGQGFNGKFDIDGGASLYQSGNAVESWYQPKGEFKIQHRFIGGRGGQSPLTETTCFAQNSALFLVSFDPAEIHKDNPVVELELAQEPKESLCQIVIQSLNVRPKQG